MNRRKFFTAFVGLITTVIGVRNVEAMRSPATATPSPMNDPSQYYFVDPNGNETLFDVSKVNWTPDQIEEFQSYFDVLTPGGRIKVLRYFGYNRYVDTRNGKVVLCQDASEELPAGAGQGTARKAPRVTLYGATEPATVVRQ
jgi:hypothetical protein